MNKDILITGIPRSGTSLITSILSTNTKAVVFSEPSWLKEVREKASNCQTFLNELETQIITIRKKIEYGKIISLKRSNQEKGLPSNYYIRDNNGKVISNKKEQNILLPKEYFDNTFIIKANAQFTACIKSLVKSNKFNLICIIRNPISVIMSWRSLGLPVSYGKMKVAEKYSSDYLNYLEHASNLLEKQVLIIDWFFKQYKEYSENITLIKYENLINNPKIEISKILSLDTVKTPDLTTQNSSKHYNLKEFQIIKTCLLKKGEYYKYFYPDL